MEKGSRHTGKKIALHPRIIANEAYLANPNIVRGDQPPVNPNREIEQMLRSVTPKGIVTPEANRSLGVDQGEFNTT